MPRQVRGPDGVVRTFPDDATDDEIAQALDAAQPRDTYKGPDTFMGGFTQGVIPGMKSAAREAVSGIGQGIKDIAGSVIPAAKDAAELALRGPIGFAVDRYQKSPSSAQTTGALRTTGTAVVDAASDPAKTLNNPARNARIVTNVGAAVVGPKVADVVGRTVGPWLQDGAVSAYERMLKPNRSALQDMTRMGDTLPDRSRNVARQLIADPNGQISKGGADAFSAATDSLQGKVDELVAANPEARGSTQNLRDAMGSGRKVFEQQWAQNGDTSAYDRVASEVLSNPSVTKTKRSLIDTSIEQQLGLAPDASEVRVTGREMIPRVRANTARKLTQGTYRTLGDKAYGELKGAETQAQKAAASGGRAILNEAIPAVEPINNDIARRIDLQQVLDDAVFRSGKHDPIGLGQQIVASGAHPLTLPASVLNRPGIGGPIARTAFRMGGAMTNIDPQIVRLLLLQQMRRGVSDQTE